MNRANYLPAPHYFNLNQACEIVRAAFNDRDAGVYLVGSSLRTREYRDVDIRCIMADKAYDDLFGEGSASGPQYNPLWSLMCSSISLFLSQHSGLPVDFQIQRQTEANAEFSQKTGCERSAIGIFYERMRTK